MYNLIIADDEEIERKAFSLFIARTFPEIKVAEAINGIELVDQVMRNEPDIIVADINMPGLNGLDAIKMLRSKKLDAKIIILTAHDQFEYAQQALSLGADHYVLKPVKREKMMQTIQACMSSIDEEAEKSDKRRRLEKIVEELDPVIETDVMISLLLEPFNQDGFQIYLDILGIHFSEGYVVTFDLATVGKNLKQTDDIDVSVNKKEVVTFIKKEMKANYHCLVGPLTNNRVSVLVVHENPIHPERFKVLSTQFSELISQKVYQSSQSKIRIGIGRLYQSANALPKSHRESILSLADQTVRSCVTYYGDIYGESLECKVSIENEKEIVKHILQNNRAACNAVLQALFEEYEELNEMERVKDRILSFLVLLNRSLEEAYPSVEHKFLSLNRIYKEVLGFGQIKELEIWVQRIIDLTFRNLETARKTKINSHVKKAIQYMNMEYMKDLSLEQVATEIGISPYYLSRLFKQESGKTFIEYLTEIRIAQAMLLLKGDTYSIKELAEKVGYTNSTYFCKVFKKHTGKTIGAYKA